MVSMRTVCDFCWNNVFNYCFSNLCLFYFDLISWEILWHLSEERFQWMPRHIITKCCGNLVNQILTGGIHRHFKRQYTAGNWLLLKFLWRSCSTVCPLMLRPACVCCWAWHLFCWFLNNYQYYFIIHTSRRHLVSYEIFPFLSIVDFSQHSSDCDGVNWGSKHTVYNLDIL